MATSPPAPRDLHDELLQPDGHRGHTPGRALGPHGAETLSVGPTKTWTLHIGASFTDVPTTNNFYRFIETLLHKGITGGCTGTTYCPSSSTTREQMSVFVLIAKEGAGYTPPACTTPVFLDVPPTSPFCRFIEELVRRGVTSGCGGGNYCPGDSVTRAQMAVFVLRTLDPPSSARLRNAGVNDGRPAIRSAGGSRSWSAAAWSPAVRRQLLPRRPGHA